MSSPTRRRTDLESAPEAPDAGRVSKASGQDRLNPGSNTVHPDRGISDVVGFVLTVGIILIGVGLVGTVGVEQIEQFEGAQSVQNAERGMTVVAGNLESVQESGAVVLTSELAVHNGRLATGTGSGNSELTVDVLGPDVTIPPQTYQMRTLSYTAEDTSIVYEGGALIRDNPEGEDIPLRGPAFVCSDDRALVSFTTIAASDAGQGYSGSTATIRTRINETRIRYPAERVGPDSLGESEGVVVTINSQHDAAWNRLLTEAGWTQTGPSQYRCDASGSLPVLVRQTVVDIDMS